MHNHNTIPVSYIVYFFSYDWTKVRSSPPGLLPRPARVRSNGGKITFARRIIKKQAPALAGCLLFMSVFLSVFYIFAK